MAGTFEYFKFIVILQLLFAFSITSIVYVLPDEAKQQIVLFEPVHSPDIDEYAVDVEDTIGKEMNVPLVDMGTLLFFSGNVVVDLMLNTILAIPEMVVILVSGLLYLFPIDVYLAVQLKVFIFAAIAIIYVIMLIAFVADMRSRGGIA